MGKRSKFRPILEGVKVRKVLEDETTYYVMGERKDNREKYYCCGKKMHIHDNVYVTLKDSEYRGKNVKLKIRKQKYKCSKCRRTITSNLEFVNKRCTYTNFVKNNIRGYFKNSINFKMVSKLLGVSHSTVFREFDSIDIQYIDKKIEILYIDEFKGNTGKEKYQFITYNQDHEIVSILKNRKGHTIREFLKKLNEKHDIKIVVMDLFAPFRGVVNKCLPNAKIVADAFHYIRQVQWMVRDVRTRLHNSKEVRYSLFKRYWKLLATNHTILSNKQTERIKDLLSMNNELKEAYEYKCEFEEIFNYAKNNKIGIEFKVEKLIYKLEKSKVKECNILSSTLTNWKDEIILSMQTQLNNGFVEGKNNKIKVIKRVSYGLQRFDRLCKHIVLKV